MTISGAVNRIILSVDDGKSSQTYYGLDNGNLASRFNFYGEAKLSSSVKVGFDILVSLAAGGYSPQVSQLDEDGKAPSKLCASMCPSFNEHNVDAYFADARRHRAAVMRKLNLFSSADLVRYAIRNGLVEP